MTDKQKEKLTETVIWIKVQPHKNYTNAIVELFDTSINQALAEERARVVGIVDEKVKEYHKDCLTDMFINGKFWAYKEMQGLLSLLDKPVTSNK